MLRDHSTEARDDGWTRETKRADWREIDRNLRRIARRRAALDAEEARWLREAVRGEIWHELGAATLEEYLERRLGYTPRAAADRVRVALALESLPELTDALATGELPFTAVRELVRVATPQTEAEWRAHARSETVREIEDAVSGRARGDRPGDAERPELRLGVLRFEVRPETLARLRQAQQALEATAGMRLDDDALVAALCAAVLEPAEAPRAKHQILTVICDRCGQGWQESAGKRVAIGQAATDRAHCDAERIDPATQRARQEIPPKVRRFVWRRDRGRCCVPGCRASRYLEVHHVRPRAAGGGHEPENLALICGAHHRALHDGQLTITGRAPELAVVTHVGRDQVTDEVRGALVEMGFTRGAARAAIDAALARVGRQREHAPLRRAALRAAAS